MPSPADYSSQSMRTRKGSGFHADNSIREKTCTFGESRRKVYRLHIDQILHVGDEDKPAPGTYERNLQWNVPKDYTAAKTTPQFSMG